MDQDTGTAGEDAGRRVCYGLVAVDLLTILFCSLANLAGVAVACAVTGVAALLLALAFWFAPARGGGGTAHRMCACGLAPGVSTASLPTFKYEPAAADAAGGGVGEGSSVLCAVCLEGVEAGDMVRQLPACSHLFHVDCIDVWLRSRRTCPLCRCVLGPAARKPSGSASITAAAMAAAAMGSGGVVVPPV